MYKLLIGKTPFFDKSIESMQEKIKTSKPKWPDQVKFKIAYSPEFVDCVEQLLNKDPEKRLGKNGNMEILEHPVFKDLDIDQI